MVTMVTETTVAMPTTAIINRPETTHTENTKPVKQP